MYVDSDAIADGVLTRPTRLPDWDPVLFLHAPHLVGLIAVDRDLVRQVDAFADADAARAEGPAVEEWETLLRLAAAGRTPRHLPEILTVRRADVPPPSPDAIPAPARLAGMTRFLGATRSSAQIGLAGGSAQAVLSLPSNAGQTARRFATCVLPERLTRDVLRQRLAALPADADRVVLISDACQPPPATPLAHIAALFELFDDSVMVGGCIHDGTSVGEAGYVFGYGGFIGCPDRGRALADDGYLGLMRLPRSVAAVSARHAVVARAFLTRCVDALPDAVDLALLGPWLGAQARREGRRVIYAPACTAVVPTASLAGPGAPDQIELAIAFGDLSGDLTGYARGLCRAGSAPYTPEGEAPEQPIATYAAYLERRVARRAASLSSARDAAPSISVLTTVYARTDAGLFAQTAASMQAQTALAREWLVLSHGPIGDDLAAMLGQLAADGAITWLKHEVNLGIHGGLRYCLERASGDFVLALDADDLLTPDALAVLADAAAHRPEARIFFSDEDFLIDGKPTLPFHRPDFDPVHARAHSSIWHAILYDRRLALALGVYSSDAVQYALDWDVLLRFEAAGHRPVHVPEVLYHWRQHGQSLSNSGTINDGTLRSIQGALESIRQRAPGADNLSVEPYPIDAGMRDFYLRRQPRHPPPTGLVRLLLAEGRVGTPDPDFPFAGITSIAAGRGPAGVAALREALRHVGEDIVVLLGEAAEIADPAGLWQAVKHLEQVPDVVAVGGALCGIAGPVLFGAPVGLDSGILVDPLAGRPMLAQSRYSFNLLKPHCVDAVAIDVLVARRAGLLAVLDAAPAQLGLRSLGWWLADVAARGGGLVAYEPLLRGFVRQQAMLIGDGVGGLQTAMTAFASPVARRPDVRRGVAGFAMHARIHGG
jgi:hypothetical protein